MTNNYLTNSLNQFFFLSKNLLVTLTIVQFAFISYTSFDNSNNVILSSKTLGVSLNKPQLPHEEIILPTPTPVPTQSATNPSQTTIQNDSEWGVAKQIDDVTWTIKVGTDEKMGTPQEIANALNAYRARHGIHSLSWDEKLAGFAQSRADHFASIGSTDKHAGFNSFLEGDGFDQLGFNSVGENSSYGYHLEGVHLIEWVYAGDEPHDNNQLNSKWTHVGVGVNGTATNLIFGGNKQ